MARKKIKMVLVRNIRATAVSTSDGKIQPGKLANVPEAEAKILIDLKTCEDMTPPAPVKDDATD